MNHKHTPDASAVPSDDPQGALDAFLFKDNLSELIHALMEESNWQIPAAIEEQLFIDTVLDQMRGNVSEWVRTAASYFLDNSEYFLSNQDALAIFELELKKRSATVSESVRNAFLEFLYRDFPNFCSQSIQMALEDATAPKL